MKKILLGAGIVICALSVALAVQVNQKNTTKISKLLAKNIQALAMIENGNENGGENGSGEGGDPNLKCPSPYDPRNRQLDFCIETYSCTIEKGGSASLSFGGKTITVTGKVGEKVEVTIFYYCCDKFNYGTCCPWTEIGKYDRHEQNK